MSCSGKNAKTGGNKPYTPKPKAVVHRNLGISGGSGSQSFGRPKVTARFSGRSK
mgnify:CR=1 FL=1